MGGLERSSNMDGTIYDSDLKRLQHEAINIKKLEEAQTGDAYNMQQFRRKPKIGYVTAGVGEDTSWAVTDQKRKYITRIIELS